MKTLSDTPKHSNELELVSMENEENHYWREIENLFPEVPEKDLLDYIKYGLHCHLSRITEPRTYITDTLGVLHIAYHMGLAAVPLVLASISGPLSGIFDWATREPVNREQYMRTFYRLTFFDTYSKRKDFIEAVLEQCRARDFLCPQSKSSKNLIEILSKTCANKEYRWNCLLRYMFENINKNNGKALASIIHDLAENFLIKKYKYHNLNLFFKSEEAASIPRELLDQISEKYIRC